MFTVIEAQDRRVGRKIRVQTGSLICNTVIGLSEIQPTSLFCFSFSLGRNKSSFIAFIICSDSLICGTYLAVMPFWSMGLCTGGLQVQPCYARAWEDLGQGAVILCEFAAAVNLKSLYLNMTTNEKMLIDLYWLYLRINWNFYSSNYALLFQIASKNLTCTFIFYSKYQILSD